MNHFLQNPLSIKTVTKLLYILLFTTTLFTGCKKEGDPNVSPDIVADSSSISSLIVSCKSSDAATTGFATVDIQQFFSAKKLVSSTVKGKIFSVKAANEAVFKAVIDKLILDLQVPESYFKNYDSFLSIVEEQFKTKTGYQKAYDINQAQIEQLFNNQGIALAFQESGLKSAFLKNIFFASAGLGTLSLAPLAETFTINRFQGLITVGSKITGSISSNQTIKNLVGTGGSRSTSLTKDDQVMFKSFNSGSSGGSSYSYSYPLPPSPAPIFDAPAWYWHQYTVGTSGANIGVIPPGASTTTWATAQDRYQAIRLKAQQVTGATVTATAFFSGSSSVTDAETAYILYSANFSQRFKDQTITLWITLDDKKHEFYQIGLGSASNGSLSIIKAVNAGVTNGNYYGDPAWTLGWNK